MDEGQKVAVFSVAPGYGFHQQRKGSLQSCCSGRFTFVVAKAHYHEIMGWHDHRYLLASTRHVIGRSWDGILAKAIDPKKPP